MTVNLTAEQKAFVRVFMRNGGCQFDQCDVENFMSEYEHGDAYKLIDQFGREMYSAVLDALDVWHSAILFEKQQTLLKLNTIG